MVLFTQPLTIAVSSSTGNGQILGGTAGSGQIAVQTSTQGNLSPYIFGVGTEGGCSPGTNTYCALVNSSWQNTYNQQNWRLFRFNTTTTFDDWPNSSSAQNAFNGLGQFWNNVASPTDMTKNRLIFTLGSPNFSVTTSDAVAIANAFRNSGNECFYWEFWNEPDGRADVNDYCNQFNSIQSALKGVNANYKVGGPTTTFERGDWLGPLASNCNPDFISWHMYLGDGSNLGDTASVFSNISSRSSGDVQDSENNFTSKPIFLGEWNLDFNGQAQMMQTIDGAVAGSLYLGSALGVSSNVEMGAIWTIGENNNFTIVNNDGSNIRPMGYMLAKLGRTMGGTRHQVSNNGVNSNLKVFASATNDNMEWAIWITNMDVNSAHSVGIVGLATNTGNYQYWELSPQNTTPLVQTKAMSTLSSISIPARSIVVLSSKAT